MAFNTPGKYTGRQRSVACARLVILREQEDRESTLHERHWPVVEFGRRDSLSMQSRRFLQLERGLLRGAEAEVATQHEEVPRILQRPDRGAPVQFPGRIQAIR